MTSDRRRPLILAILLSSLTTLAAVPLSLAASSVVPPAGGAMTILVDASEAPRKIFHAKLNLAATPGPMTLLYPKWLPGEHGPTGPITDLAGLKMRPNSGFAPSIGKAAAESSPTVKSTCSSPRPSDLGPAPPLNPVKASSDRKVCCMRTAYDL